VLQLLVLKARDPNLVLDGRRVEHALAEHLRRRHLPARLLVHKRHLAAEFPNDRDAYTRAKGGFVQDVLQRAAPASG